MSFVGGGPGDPGLLTLRAAELLRAADVVVTEAPTHEPLVRRLLGQDDIDAGPVPDAPGLRRRRVR